MKNVAIFLLFCLAFGSVITSKRSLGHKIAKAIRKLQGTQVVTSVAEETSV